MEVKRGREDVGRGKGWVVLVSLPSVHLISVCVPLFESGSGSQLI